MQMNHKTIIFILFILLIISMPWIYMNTIGKYIIDKYLNIVCLPETRMCGFLEIAFLILYLKIQQIFAIIFITTYTITNNTTQTLKKFFNKGKEYILLLVFIISIDIMINHFSNNIDDLFGIYDFSGTYNLYFSPSLCYFIIFLIITIHRLTQMRKMREY